MEKYSLQNLRKNEFGRQRKWTFEEIRSGFEYYKELYGKYPSALEIDKFDYLPSTRSLERNFGGLVEVRQGLGLPEDEFDHTKGLRRSKVAKDMYAKGAELEDKFYEFLMSHIDEIRIHEHKILRPGRVCCDFFIFNKNKEGIAIDVFYAYDLHALQGIVRIKLLRYSQLHCKVLFILVGNEDITQEDINKLIESKKNKMPPHVEVITEEYFRSSLNQYIDK